MPSVTSYRRGINWISEDLEEPVPPMMPMVSPDRMCKSISSSAIRSACGEYLKLTCSKETEPSATSYRGCSGFVSVLVSVRTSTMRLPDSSAIRIITNTMDSIIRLLSIMKLYVSRAENCPTSRSRPREVMMVYDPKDKTKTITV